MSVATAFIGTRLECTDRDTNRVFKIKVWILVPCKGTVKHEEGVPSQLVHTSPIVTAEEDESTRH
jgi:hypothetical protein